VICYDVEFPELSRLMADQGMNILFVPFLTDTQNGYTRVKHCAQARAIENECYVAIAGCVGNLPKSTIWIFSMHSGCLHPLILHSQAMESKQKQLKYRNDFNCRC
jgi:predicted amidohydrolase